MSVKVEGYFVRLVSELDHLGIEGMPAAIRHDDPGRGGTPSQRARRPYDSSGMAVVGILNAVLPPFQLADDDTLRERIPVALALPDVVVDHPD